MPEILKPETFKEQMLQIEVAYALPHKQKIISIEVAVGTSVLDAAKAAKMEQHFAGLDVEKSSLGIFGKLVPKPEQQLIEAGQRIEIYRPLTADPKAARIQRAARQTNA